MGYPALRKTYPKYAGIADDGQFLNAVHQGEFAGAPEEAFAQAASQIEKEGATAGTSTGNPRIAPPPSPGGVPASLVTSPGQAIFRGAMGIGKGALGVAKNLATDAANVPRGLFFDPIRQIAENRPATPEEEKRSLSGLAGLATLLWAGPLVKLGEAAAAVPETAPAVARVGARIAADAGVGSVLGATDAAIRSGGNVDQTKQGMAGGAFFGPPGGYLARKIFGHDINPIESLRTVGGRIAHKAPDVAQMLEASVQEGQVGAGKIADDLLQAGFKKLTAQEDEALGDALRGRLKPDALSPRARAVYDVADRWRKDVASRASAYGTQVQRGESRVPFAPRANHFPQFTPETDAPEKVVSAMVKNAVKEGRFKSEAQARAAWADYGNFVRSGGKQGGDLLAQKLLDEGQANSLAEARGKLLRFARAKNNRNPSLEHSRTIDFPFYDPSPSRVLPRHAESTERRLSEILHLGQDSQLIDEAVGSIHDEADRQLVGHLVKVARGQNEMNDPALSRVLDFGRKAALFKFSPFTSIKNAGQTTNSLLASDLPSFLKGTAKAFTKEGGRIARRSGAASESAIHNVEHQVGAESGASGKFLKMIGFTPIERGLNRRVSANVGAEMAKKFAGKLAKNPGDTFAANELRRLGLDPERVKVSGLREDDVLRAALDFTKRTQFRSHALDLPAAANESNLGRATAQFKTFGYQHGNLISDEIAGRLTSGNASEKRRALRNLAILGTAFPLTGEAINDVIALTKGEKRKAKGLARWAENMGSTGGVGIAGDLAQTVTEYGKGDRGGSLAKALGPPSVAIGAETVQMLADIKARQDSGKPLTPYQQKWLARQIPGAGPIIAARMKGEKK